MSGHHCEYILFGPPPCCISNATVQIHINIYIGVLPCTLLAQQNMQYQRGLFTPVVSSNIAGTVYYTIHTYTHVFPYFICEAVTVERLPNRWISFVSPERAVDASFSVISQNLSIVLTCAESAIRSTYVVFFPSIARNASFAARHFDGVRSSPAACVLSVGRSAEAPISSPAVRLPPMSAAVVDRG